MVSATEALYVHLLFPFADVRVFQEWCRNRYGVFPESGFPGDRLYPEFYADGADGALTKNEDCDNITAINELRPTNNGEVS